MARFLESIRNRNSQLIWPIGVDYSVTVNDIQLLSYSLQIITYKLSVR